MAKIPNTLAIDIGADSLKIAEFSYPQTGGLILEKFAFKEYGGDLKEEELAGALKNALDAALTENHFNTRNVCVSISGQSAFIRFVKLPPIGDKEERIRQVVEYEAKQNVPFPIEQVVWDYQLIGSAEGETEIEVMFVVIKDTIIEEIVNTIEAHKMQIDIIDVAPVACYNAARANEIGGTDCVMLLNIGSRCSSLVFIDSGRFFVRTIPIAGHSITQQISKEFGIPFNDAEELKRKHGFVALGGAYEEPDSEVAATISKIVRNVMTRLHGEINRSINVYRSQQKGGKPVKLCLAGGSSVMAFTPRFFTEKLKIQTEYFNPFQVVSLSPNINREELAEVAHMFSEVIGLGLRKATVCPIEISLVPQKIKKIHEIKQKAPYFYMSAASLLLCLTLIFLAFNKTEQIDRKKAEISTQEVAKVEKLSSEVKTEKAKFDAIVFQYNTAQKILQARTAWIDLFREIESLIPPNMWITSIEAKPSSQSVQTAEEPITSQESRSKTPFAPFKRAPKKTASAVEATGGDLNWVVLKGYFLTLGQNEPLEQKLKENIAKSPIFTDDMKEINTLAFDDKPTKNSADNITSFIIEAKLKKPINK